MNDFTIHPAANLFPTMTDEELQGLIQDIRDNGQREDATIWNGQLIDGRNRLSACNSLGIELECCELDGDYDPIKWVLSHNLHRRHLTPSQKAQVAVKLKKMLEPEAKERKRDGGKQAGNGRPKKDAAKLPQAKREPDSRTQAAAMLGISGKLVDAAEKVETKGTPELNAAVASGKVSVSRAAKIADAPKDKQAELMDRPRTLPIEPPLKGMVEKHPDKITLARWLFDSCTEAQRAQVSVAWSDWWKESA